MAKKKCAILLIDDVVTLRSLLAKFLLDYDSNYRIPMTTDSYSRAQQQLKRRKYNVVVINVTMMNQTGLYAIAALHKANPSMPILAYSNHGPYDIYAQFAIQEGAYGFISMHQEPEEWVKAICAVKDGGNYLCPRLRDKLYQDIVFKNGNERDQLLSSLSKKELEVFMALGRGYKLEKIAEEMNLTRNTVKTYQERLCRKMKLSSKGQLLEHAIAISHVATPFFAVS